MPGFFDRIGKAAQQTAAAAQQTANDARVRLEIRNLGAHFDERAQALGRLMHRHHKGETIPEADYSQVLQEMDDLEAQRAAKEAELATIQHPEVSVVAPMAPASVAPAPTPAPAAEPTTAIGTLGQEQTAGAPVPAPAAEPTAGPRCECGAVNSPGARFCASCGKLLAS